MLFRCGTPPFQFFVQTDTENFLRGEEVVDTLFQTVCINVFAEVRNIGYLLLRRSSHFTNERNAASGCENSSRLLKIRSRFGQSVTPQFRPMGYNSKHSFREYSGIISVSCTVFFSILCFISTNEYHNVFYNLIPVTHQASSLH